MSDTEQNNTRANAQQAQEENAEEVVQEQPDQNQETKAEASEGQNLTKAEQSQMVYLTKSIAGHKGHLTRIEKKLHGYELAQFTEEFVGQIIQDLNQLSNKVSAKIYELGDLRMRAGLESGTRGRSAEDEADELDFRVETMIQFTREKGMHLQMDKLAIGPTGQQLQSSPPQQQQQSPQQTVAQTTTTVTTSSAQSVTATSGTPQVTQVPLQFTTPPPPISSGVATAPTTTTPQSAPVTAATSSPQVTPVTGTMGGINPNGLGQTPTTPPTPWATNPNAISIPRLPTQAFLNEAQRLGSAGLFAPNPRIPGVLPEEQRHLDSIYETSMKKIPNLNLGKFSVKNSEDFERWEDHFQRVIGRHVTMDKVTKLAYLEDCLTGEAKKHIVAYTAGLKKEDAYDAALLMLHKLYGGAIKRENKALHRFARLEPLRDMSQSELTRIFIGVSNLMDYHKTNGNTYILQASGNADFRDCRRKLGSYVKEYDLWALQNMKEPNMTTLHQYLELMHQAALLSSTIDASDDEDGVAHYGGQRRDKRDRRSKDKRTSDRGPFQKKEEKKDSPKAPRKSSGGYKCSKCKGEHKLFKCETFKKMAPAERWKHVKKEEICSRCIEGRHKTKDCSKNWTCRECQRDSHHTLLHDPDFAKKYGKSAEKKHKSKDKKKKSFTASGAAEDGSSSDSDSEDDDNAANNGVQQVSMQSRTGRVAIQVGEVNVHSNGTVSRGRLLIDSGCDNTNVVEIMAQECKMKAIGEPTTRSLSVMGGKTVKFPGSQLVEFGISPLHYSKELKKHGVKKGQIFNIRAYTMPSACGKVPAVDWSHAQEKYKHLQDIKLPKFSRKENIDIVLGTNYAGLMAVLDSRVGKSREPAAHLTKLGWFLFGNAGKGKASSSSYKATTLLQDEKLEMLGKLHMEYHELDGGAHLKNRPLRRTDLEAKDKETPRRANADTSESRSTGTAMETQEITRSDNALLKTIQDGAYVARQRKFDSPKAQAEYDKIVITEKEGFYEARIPWKEDVPQFRNNMEQVLQRQKMTLSQKSLEKKTITLQDILDIMDNYVKKGYIRKLSPEEVKEPNSHYLPHFPVVDKSRSTTKIREVFDAAAVYNGKSLNSEMTSGPNLLINFLQILVRFRRFKVCLASDISEMFLRIRSHPDDRRFHRFLCGDPNGTMDAYEWMRTLFGGRSIPNISQKTLHALVEDHGKEHVFAALVLLRSCYMDDLIDSMLSEKQAIETAKGLTNILKHADMVPGKFASNSKAVLESIPEDKRAKEVSLVNNELTISEGKVLGVYWDPQDDTLKLRGDPTPGSKKKPKTKAKMRNGEFVWTTRTVLSTLFKCYDPLGMVSPFTVRGKVILQRLTLLKRGWDEEIPEHYKTLWTTWLQELQDMETFKIPRHLGFTENTKFHLICFVDASIEAVCAVFYVRTEDGNNVQTQFLFSKTKVTPSKALSVARLELMAAAMGAETSVSLKKYLGDISKCVFFTDAADVLWWVHQPSKLFKPYVANRSGLIQRLTDARCWRKVPTKINPADIGSRGSSLQDLANNTLWKSGPPFLQKPEEEWGGVFHIDEYTVAKQVSDEMRPFLAMKATAADDPLERFLDPTRWSVGDVYNGWEKLKGRVVLLLRAIEKLLKKKTRSTTNELQERAERILFRRSQLHSYGDVLGSLDNAKKMKKTKLKQLTPFLDKEGLLRSRSRLEYADHMTYDNKNPIVLSAKEPIALLYIMDKHRQIQHPVGKNALRGHLMQRFLIQAFYHAERHVERRCLHCIKRRATSAEQLQAPLPLARFDQQTRAFTNTGMDFMGPFKVKVRRATRAASGESEAYVLLFCCYTTRAVHLEVTYGLSTQIVYNALSRFCDKRGVPSVLYSDNQTSFVALDKELKEMHNKMDLEELKVLTQHGFKQSSGIEWRFNTPKASHHGAPFEIMVKAAKRSLRAIYGYSSLTPDEFATSISNCERLINSRPLTMAKVESSEPVPLTPMSFLIGNNNAADLSPPTKMTASDLCKRWRLLQDTQNHFWRRWNVEILPMLHPRKRWQSEQANLKEGGLVIEIDPDTPRGLWKMAKIEKVFPSTDGHVRSVQIKMVKGGKTYERPITKLLPLEFASD